MNFRAIRAPLLALFFAYFGLVAAGFTLMAVFRQPPRPSGVVMMSIAAGILAWGHAAYALGWRRALAFFGIAAVVSWIYEQAGVTSGAVFGSYYYTGVLGAKLGAVPVAIPIAWFEYLYCSYIMANCLLAPRPIGTAARTSSFLLLVLTTAVLTTAQDLVVDPVMSGESIQAWVWEESGAYFGVPTANFLGWLATALVAGGLYRLVDLRYPPVRVEPLSRIMIMLPLLLYGISLALGMSVLAPAALRVIAPFVVGLPLLLAFGRIWFPTLDQAPQTGS